MSDSHRDYADAGGRSASPSISTSDLMSLGLEQIAYVKPVSAHGAQAYAIHAADGSQLAVVPNRAIALATVRQNDLEPVSVH